MVWVWFDLDGEAVGAVFPEVKLGGFICLGLDMCRVGLYWVSVEAVYVDYDGDWVLHPGVPHSHRVTFLSQGDTDLCVREAR